MRRPFVDRRLSRKCHPPVSNSSLCTLPRLHELSCGGTGIRGLGFMSKIPFQTRRGKTPVANEAS